MAPELGAYDHGYFNRSTKRSVEETLEHMVRNKAGMQLTSGWKVIGLIHWISRPFIHGFLSQSGIIRIGIIRSNNLVDIRASSIF